MEQRHNNQEPRQSANPCRAFLLSTFYLIPILLSLPNAFAQTFPLSGATWIFKSSFNIGYGDVFQKWEYVGDSLVQDGTLKKIKVTHKHVNPYWIPHDTVVISQSYRNFLYSGDTVRALWEDSTIIANFSLQTGDSTYTPYYRNSLSFDGWGDSCIIDFHLAKGVVTDVGTDTVDNITYRFYELEYTSPWGNMERLRFSERQLMEIGRAWFFYLSEYPTWCSLGGGVVDAPTDDLRCYYDDFSLNESCEIALQFDQLSVHDFSINGEVSVFPNPARDVLNISNSYRGDAVVRIMDMQGRIVQDNIRVHAEVFISLFNYKPGVYMLHYVNENGESGILKFIKK